MKSLAFFFAFNLWAMSSFAQSLSLYVEKYYCLENQEVCVLKGTDSKMKKRELFFSKQDFNHYLLKLSLQNKQITLPQKDLHKLSLRERQLLKRQASDIHYSWAKANNILLSQIQQFLDKFPSILSIRSSPGDFAIKEISASNLKLRGHLRDFLRREQKVRLEDWKNYVLESSNFEQLEAHERSIILKHPKKHLNIKSIFEFSDAWAITHQNLVVGYFIRFNDLLLTEITKEDAWIDFYTDKDQFILRYSYESH